jgi:hypothetical protein
MILAVQAIFVVLAILALDRAAIARKDRKPLDSGQRLMVIALTGLGAISALTIALEMIA